MVAERLNRLARVATELQAVGNLEGLTNIVVSHMADAAGATAASVSVLVDDDTLALMGLRGGTPGASARWATYPVSDDNPAAVTVRTAEAAAAGRAGPRSSSSSPTSSSALRASGRSCACR